MMEFMNKKPVFVATLAAYAAALIYVVWAIIK
jgi:hypothetical protein